MRESMSTYVRILGLHRTFADREMKLKVVRGEYQARRSLTLKTCLQFLPLSFSLLSMTSMISTKSFLRTGQATEVLLRHMLDSLVVGHLRELVHLLSCRWPWIVTCRVPDLDLSM